MLSNSAAFAASTLCTTCEPDRLDVPCEIVPTAPLEPDRVLGDMDVEPPAVQSLLELASKPDRDVKFRVVEPGSSP